MKWKKICVCVCGLPSCIMGNDERDLFWGVGNDTSDLFK